MEIKVLKTKKDYNNAVSMLEALGDETGFEQNPALIRQFELLSALIEKFESEHAPVPVGAPIEIILLKMQYMGLKRKDLIPIIGSSGLVSDVLNKKRALSKNMIRSLADFLKLDQNLLNRPYKLIIPERSAKKSSENSDIMTFAFKFIQESETKQFKQHVARIGTLLTICP